VQSSEPVQVEPADVDGQQDEPEPANPTPPQDEDTPAAPVDETAPAAPEQPELDFDHDLGHLDLDQELGEAPAPAASAPPPVAVPHAPHSDDSVTPAETSPEEQPPVKRRPRPTPGAGVDLAARLAAAEAARQQGTATNEAEPEANSAVNVARKTPSGQVPEGGAAKSFLQRTSAEDDAEDDHRGSEPPTKVKRRRIGGGGRLAIILVIAALAALGVRTYVVAPYYIPSQSMEPTLYGCPGCNNDHVLVDKLSYHLHSVHRGDIVVFNRPTSWQVSEHVLIKRVIGLPGDVLSVKGGTLYVNGQELSEPYLNKNCGKMANFADSPNDSTATTLPPVPKGDVFVMGDNRCQSEDSRAFGPIPKSKIIGRAFLIIWPLKHLHSL